MIRMFRILEPTTLPIAISSSFFLDAITEVTNSGSDVPIAIIVSPITRSLIFNQLAISTALSTTKSPLITTPANPNII